MNYKKSMIDLIPIDVRFLIGEYEPSIISKNTLNIPLYMIIDRISKYDPLFDAEKYLCSMLANKIQITFDKKNIMKTKGYQLFRYLAGSAWNISDPVPRKKGGYRIYIQTLKELSAIKDIVNLEMGYGSTSTIKFIYGTLNQLICIRNDLIMSKDLFSFS